LQKAIRLSESKSLGVLKPAICCLGYALEFR
jgi:hypothetical protein